MAAAGIISFTIRPLQWPQIQRAYVLAQAAMPNLTLEQFEQECTATLNPELREEKEDKEKQDFPGPRQDRNGSTSWRYADSGLARCNFIVATDINDHIRGLCYTRIEEHLTAGRLFDVPIFIVVSLLQEQEIAAKLFDVMRKRALHAQCNYLRVWALRPENWSLLDNDEFRHRWDHGTIFPL
ncbi:hypothetical protein [Rhizobium binae]|uniref:hypothetical protein n=1 Tax=Rhizobium binae TaxID=1138190 RepID=UPI001C82E1A1|nr:hypothetical protein [Rhizobium binae]MBX4968339.1 hypothetical protein [Rhizobium binae]